jgi:CBS domain-containing protein
MKFIKEKILKFKNPEPDLKKFSAEFPAVSEKLEVYKLAEIFKAAKSDTLPVINDYGEVTGIVSEFDLAKVLEKFADFDREIFDSLRIKEIMTKNVFVKVEGEDTADLFTNLPLMNLRVIPIITAEKEYTGKCILRTNLINHLANKFKPLSIGGLATPIGVYMTDGKHTAGAGVLGLVLSGVYLAVIAELVQLISVYIITGLNLSRTALIFLQIILFLLILRFTHLAKFHSAEHQTISAMEKGLPLTPETVKMQPKEHPRCGTNLMVMLIGIQVIVLISYEYLQAWHFISTMFVVIGILVLINHWKTLGYLVQKYLTTVKAGEKEILNSIAVGNELLQIQKKDPDLTPPSRLTKIWNTGIIYIFISFILTIELLGRFFELTLSRILH